MVYDVHSSGDRRGLQDVFEVEELEELAALGLDLTGAGLDESLFDALQILVAHHPLVLVPRNDLFYVEFLVGLFQGLFLERILHLVDRGEVRDLENFLDLLGESAGLLQLADDALLEVLVEDVGGDVLDEVWEGGRVLDEEFGGLESHLGVFGVETFLEEEQNVLLGVLGVLLSNQLNEDFNEILGDSHGLVVSFEQEANRLEQLAEPLSLHHDSEQAEKLGSDFLVCIFLAEKLRHEVPQPVVSCVVLGNDRKDLQYLAGYLGIAL